MDSVFSSHLNIPVYHYNIWNYIRWQMLVGPSHHLPLPQLQQENWSTNLQCQVKTCPGCVDQSRVLTTDYAELSLKFRAKWEKCNSHAKHLSFWYSQCIMKWSCTIRIIIQSHNFIFMFSWFPGPACWHQFTIIDHFSALSVVLCHRSVKAGVRTWCGTSMTRCDIRRRGGAPEGRY